MKINALFILISVNLIFSQGYNEEGLEEYINSINTYSKSNLGFAADDLPVRYSLKQYVPNIGNQKDSGSCVAWAVSYYASSIIYNKSYNITTSEGKWANRFDPWFLYNQLSYQNYDKCEEGLRWDYAFDLAERVGNKKFTIPPYDLHCSKSWSREAFNRAFSLTKQYNISKVEFLEPDSASTINKIKLEVSKYSYPVVIGISHYGEALNNINTSTGYFNPTYSQDRTGHAMTIVGYDDYINGGSFLVVNSWGSDWGKNGYMWMKYSDFRLYAHAAFSMWVSFEELDKRESDVFKRIPWDNDNQIYEGQIKRYTSGNWIEHGYGINYNKGAHSYSVGRWIEGKKEGKFYIIENGEWRTERYDNDNRIYGFADSTNDDLDLYLKSLFNDSDIQKVNN